MDIINNELIYFDVLDYPTIAWVPANDTEFRKYYGLLLFLILIYEPLTLYKIKSEHSQRIFFQAQ